MRETKRTGETPENTYQETTVGDAPSSVELAFTAKGLAQPTYKLYFASPADMANQVHELLAAIHQEVAAAVHDMGARLVSEAETPATSATPATTSKPAKAAKSAESTSDTGAAA